MIRVPPVSSCFGATEKQFQAFLAAMYVNYPGMRKSCGSCSLSSREVNLPDFHIDQFEVTNRQYLEFVRATEYKPKNSVDYLKHWDAPDKHPDWSSEFPVVWISQEDAAAYCAWRRAALPLKRSGKRRPVRQMGESLPGATPRPRPKPPI